MICAPSEDSDQPGNPPSLISVFAVHSVGSWGPSVSSCGQRRLWSDRADAQADMSLRWAHISFCWFCHKAAHLFYDQQLGSFQTTEKKYIRKWARKCENDTSHIVSSKSVRTLNIWNYNKLQTSTRRSGPTGLLHMCVWKTTFRTAPRSLRSWVGSNALPGSTYQKKDRTHGYLY